jgi:hypothetical protein
MATSFNTSDLSGIIISGTLTYCMCRIAAFLNLVIKEYLRLQRAVRAHNLVRHLQSNQAVPGCNILRLSLLFWYS